GCIVTCQREVPIPEIETNLLAKNIRTPATIKALGNSDRVSPCFDCLEQGIHDPVGSSRGFRMHDDAEEVSAEIDPIPRTEVADPLQCLPASLDQGVRIGESLGNRDW